MDVSIIATVLLWSCALLASISAAADVEATRQLRSDRYRWIPQVVICRKLHGAATLLLLVFFVFVFAAGDAAIGAVAAILFACLLAFLTQGKRVLWSDVKLAWLAGFAPLLVLASTVASLDGVPGGARLPWLALVPAIVAAACFLLIARQRAVQRSLSLRDRAGSATRA